MTKGRYKTGHVRSAFFPGKGRTQSAYGRVQIPPGSDECDTGLFSHGSTDPCSWQRIIAVTCVISDSNYKNILRQAEAAYIERLFHHEFRRV